MKFKNYLEEQLKNPEIKAEYDKLTPEYENISAVIKSSLEKGINPKFNEQEVDKQRKNQLKA